jgi:hypothetical protein
MIPTASAGAVSIDKISGCTELSSMRMMSRIRTSKAGLSPELWSRRL